MFPGLDLYFVGPAQVLTPAGGRGTSYCFVDDVRTSDHDLFVEVATITT